MNRLSLIASWASLVLLVRTAWSEDNVARQEAAARFKAGVSYSYQGKWEPARVAFLQAYVIAPSANILWNLAFAELKSGHPIEALDHFGVYEFDGKAEVDKVAALPEFRERAYKAIGRIKIEAPRNSTVLVDGTQRMWAEPANVVPGEHIVKVQAGSDSEERRVTLSAGQLEVLSFVFSGKSAVSTSFRPVAPPSEVVPSAAPSERLAVAGPTGSRNLTLGWIGLGATGSALAIGIGFAIAAKEKHNEAIAADTSLTHCRYQPSLPICVDVQDTLARQHTYNQIGAVGLVSAGVFGVATAGYFRSVRRSRIDVSATPYVDLHQGGLTVRAGF